MSVNPNYDAWETDERINRHQLKAASRHELDFVMDGLGLVDAGGLLLQVDAGFAYIAGYEVENAAPDFAALADGATNHVFFGFDRTVEVLPPTSVLDIAPKVVVNTTGIQPPDTIKLGVVTTAAGVIVTITEQDNRRHVHDTQLDDDLEANHRQATNLVVHSGAVLPPITPPTTEGQLFFRTTDKKLFKFDGAAWVELAAAGAPPPPGAITVVNGTFPPTFLDVGEVVRAVPGLPGSVDRALAIPGEENAVGAVATAPIPPFLPGFAATVQGVLIPDAQFETGLVLVSGAVVFLSPFVAGALTIIQPFVIGQVVKRMGILWDPTGYIGAIPANSKAVVLLQIEEGIEVV